MNTRRKCSRRSTVRGIKNKLANLVTIDLTDDTYDDFDLMLQTAVSDAVNFFEDSISISSSLATTVTTIARSEKPERKNISKKEKTTESPKRQSSPKFGIGECTICFEQLGSANQLSVTKCGHVFCQICLMQSIEFKPNCPTCRKDLKGPDDYHPLYLNFEKYDK